MDVPVEIAFQDMEASEALEARIRDRAQRLQRFFDRINSCRVIVSTPHGSSQGGRQAFHVTVDVTVPGRELAVSRDPGAQDRHYDPHVAVRDAFDAMEKQLESFKEKKKGEVKTLNAPLQGKILRMFPDYGFIEVTDGREIYFHRNTVIGGRFEDLEADDPVELALVHGESPMGPQATTVKPIRRAEYVEDRSPR